MNAIEMLKTDHKAIRQLFARFDRLEREDTQGQHEVVQKLVTALHRHAEVEEGQFYPAVAKSQAEPAEEVQHSVEEHDHLDAMVDELAAMDACDANYRARFDALRTELSKHMREEEREMFPAARETLGAERLAALGDRMAQQKQAVATKSN